MKSAILFFIYCSIPFWGFAQKPNKNTSVHNQPSKYKHFTDYLIAAANMDSLQKVERTNPPRPNSIQYLNLHLSIQLGRHNWNDSINIKQIKQLIPLAIKHKSKPDLGIAYFILGRHYNLEKEDSLSYYYLSNAEKIFTANIDTTGMLNCYDHLRETISENYKDLAKEYFNKMISLSQASKNPTYNFFYYISIVCNDAYFKKRSTESQMQEAFKKVNEIIEKYPYLEYRRKHVYHYLYAGYDRLARNDMGLEVALQLFSDHRIKLDYFDYQALGRAYVHEKKYTEAIPVLSKGLKNLVEKRPDDLRRRRNFFRLLKMAYFGVGNLNEFKNTDDKFEKISNRIIEQDRSLAMYHLREKYSFEDKVAELKRLALEKEVAESRNKLLQSRFESEKQEANLKSAILAKSAAENRNKLLQAQVNLVKNSEVIKSLDLEKQLEQSQKRLLTYGLLAVSALTAIVGFLFIKLRRTNKELLILQKSREKLYTIIAHDLRSPISTFQRYSDIVAYLVKTKQFTRLETTTKQIDQTGKNLAVQLNNLLEWSLNQQGLIKNSPELVDIKVFFDELLPIYQDMANLSSIFIVDNIADTKIMLDPNKLSLIIRNMLDNAIKFSEENNQISISASRNENEFLMSISNKSRPSTIHQKRVLKEFFESDKDYVIGENKDLGIGSVLVKEYSTIMGAKITFDYDVDCLTIFTFSLPLITNA